MLQAFRIKEKCMFCEISVVCYAFLQVMCFDAESGRLVHSAI